MAYLKRLFLPRVSRTWQILALAYMAKDHIGWLAALGAVLATGALIEWLWEARKPAPERGS